MDQLAALLDGPRARNAFLLRSLLNPPWSLRIQDEAPLTLAALVRGSAWVLPDRGDPMELAPGEVAILRGPEPYTVADHPETAPQIIIHPGQHCTTLDGQSLYQAMDLGVRSWGNDPDGATVLITGTYQMEGEVSRRLLEALPALLKQPGGPVIGLLRDEIVKDEPGQEAVLDRLLDLLLIAALRSWFATHEAPAWYRAMGDPLVGRAMRMLQNNPAHPWTVAALAAQVGVSRASLARRFTDLVGEPPMAFLTDWRLAMAADLLREPDATVGSVARKVGYGSPFALSTAFKRVRGVSPQEYRAGVLG
ncbi:AraC family transcriptional regulator [Nonomuraea sp. NN258]|uniref:AraC family transcriptional regulator n=1 Tax=Nonomuraea antri TaxID=2730852 RepID=UPI00156A4F2D|nr:AraC family transcriptional regulator [Nonomuraea antri]NRQ31537.1 AraC family transcriptional regulator [Nonomuraea antri]